jgi:biopolymer transport protein ExbD
MVLFVVVIVKMVTVAVIAESDIVATLPSNNCTQYKVRTRCTIGVNIKEDSPNILLYHTRCTIYGRTEMSDNFNKSLVFLTPYI